MKNVLLACMRSNVFGSCAGLSFGVWGYFVMAYSKKYAYGEISDAKMKGCMICGLLPVFAMFAYLCAACDL